MSVPTETFPLRMERPDRESSPYPRMKVVYAATPWELEQKLNDFLDGLDEYAVPQVSAATVGHSPAGWHYVVLVAWSEWR